MLKRIFVNICLSRFLSEYKITEFYDKISSNVGAKVATSRAVITEHFQFSLLRTQFEARVILVFVSQMVFLILPSSTSYIKAFFYRALIMARIETTLLLNPLSLFLCLEVVLDGHAVHVIVILLWAQEVTE